MMRQSRFSMGMASSRSSPLPCGTPSMMSIKTTSASSLEALEVVRDFFLFDGALHALFDQVGGFGPAKMTKHHDAGEYHRAGINDVFVGVLGGGTVGGLENGMAVADVSAGSDAEATDLGCA